MTRRWTVLALVALVLVFLAPMIFTQLLAVAAGVALLLQRRWIAGAAVIVAVFVVSAISGAIFMKGYESPSSAMEPALANGQRFFANRAIYHFTSPKIGDIVVFHPPRGADFDRCATPPPRGSACATGTPQRSEQTYVKRIVAGPGDKLSIVRGHAVVNGSIEPGEPDLEPCATCTLRNPITIPPGHWFMMGDNRGTSSDSRLWGPVPQSWFIGKAVFSYWPPSRVGFP